MFVYLGVESINITSLSRVHVTHALYIMLYDDELYILKSNKIYVMLCLTAMTRQFLFYLQKQSLFNAIYFIIM